MKKQLSKAFIRAVQGAISAFGAPMGWLVIRYFDGAAPLVEIYDNWGLYLYMLLGTISVFSLFGWYVGNKEEKSDVLALHDPLTGLFNVRYFRERLEEEVQEAQRNATPLTLIYFDLDHFKLVNDVHGHSVGDDVLIAVSHAAKAILRKHETLARVGGEEFVGLLPRCSIKDGKEIAERLRGKVAAIRVHKNIAVTVSVGVAGLEKSDNAKTIYAKADTALYQAKANGRNRVQVAA